MTNFITSLISHWALILTILAAVHVALSVVFSALNKPKATSVMEQVWHYVQIVAGLGTRLAVSKDPSIVAAVNALTGEAATLAGK